MAGIVNPVPPILVCFALKEESAAFTRLVSGHTEVSLLLTGIGRRNAERTFRNLLNRLSPQRVFTCGFAGGLNPELKLGDVIFETADAELRDQLLFAGAKPGKFFCVTRIATTAAEKAELRRTTGADAVEMESAAIHAVCRERGIPCATVRVISDTAHEDLPLDFNAMANADQSLNYFKLTLTIAKSPGKIPALMRLNKQTKFAAERLAEILGEVIGPA